MAPLEGGGFVVVRCRYLARIGRDAIPQRVPIRWRGRRPYCNEFTPYIPQVATPVGDQGDLLVAGPWRGKVARISAGGTGRIVAGRPATAPLFSRIGGIAALPEGGFLVSEIDNHRVRRVSPDGTVTTVAGNGRDASRGDGGTAVEAALRHPRGLAVQEDGGFLVADSRAYRVRRVRPDGVIETVAGNGVRAPAVDGRRATETSLVAPVAVASEGEGAFLIADTRRVLRVGPAGHITTFAGNGGAEWGRQYAADAPLPEGNFFDGIGGPATRASIGPVSWIAGASDGSYLVRSGSNDSKLYVLPARRSRYFGIAFRKLRPRLGFISYRVNRPAKVALRVRSAEGDAQTVTARARPGFNRLRIPAGTRPGPHELRLTATAPGGYRSADEAGVIFGRTLARRIAAAAIDVDLNLNDFENLSEIGGCHRVSPTRVDCDVVDDVFDCESNVAVRLHAGGQVESVGYPCGPWRRRVPWHRSTRLPFPGILYAAG